MIRTTSGYWGYHLLLDCAQCDKEAITNPETLQKWVRELVVDIDMVPYGEPQIIHFGHGVEHLEGWTVLQFIETSNIVAHFNDHTQEGYIDIFSCKQFDDDVAIANVVKYFNPKTIRQMYLTRQADK